MYSENLFATFSPPGALQTKNRKNAHLPGWVCVDTMILELFYFLTRTERLHHRYHRGCLSWSSEIDPIATAYTSARAGLHATPHCIWQHGTRSSGWVTEFIVTCRTSKTCLLLCPRQIISFCFKACTYPPAYHISYVNHLLASETAHFRTLKLLDSSIQSVYHYSSKLGAFTVWPGRLLHFGLVQRGYVPLVWA